MSVQVQIRRGNTAQTSAFTGAVAEITVDTDKQTLVVHNGSKSGGFPLAPNTAFDVANAAFNSANNVAPQVAPSFNTANAAFDKANSANVLAYNTGIGANAYTVSVGSSGNNYAGAMANSINAYTTATYATQTDLSTGLSAGNTYTVSVGTSANNYAGAMANAANAYATATYETQIVVSTGLASGNAYANFVGTSANSYANTSTEAANNYAGFMANASNAYAASLTPDLSPAFNKANDAYTQANAAYSHANDVATGANAYSVSVGAAGNAYVNLSTGAANSYTVTVGTSANNYAGVMANSANGIADATYIKKTATTQIITGDIQITGNLILSGNATQISANNLSIQDPLIFLATNNISDIVDIGFIGHYNNGSANVHTGVYRDHASKEYYIFNGLFGEPELVNDIVPYANNMVNAVLNADLRTSNLNLGGANAIVWIRSAYDNSNAAYNNANSIATSANNYAGAMANAANAYASSLTPDLTPAFNKANDAYTIANGAFDKANSANVLAYNTGIGSNAYTNVVGTSANNYAGAMANSANAYALSLTPDLSPAFNVANGAFNKANSANVLAKAAYDYANTITGGAVVSATAPSSPSAGSFWWNTTYGRLFVYYNDGNTSQWVDATATATAARVVTTDTVPNGAVDGQLWWNSEYGRLFVYYNDGDTSQWVDTNPATDIGGITDIANAAFDKANTGATFAYVNTSAAAANAYTNVSTGAANAYTNVSTAAANNWANTKLANTNVVLAGNLTSTQGVADRIGDVRNLPIVNQTSSYTLTLADNGEVISLTTGNVFVTAGIFFPGNTVSVFNNSSANITITQNTSVTLYSAGTSNTGNRILQQRGIATIVCVAANTFVVTGAGMVP
jgi:hypothetical protein